MFGQSVKLVDFGLATSEPISNDFGCGSTFYLSPGRLSFGRIVLNRRVLVWTALVVIPHTPVVISTNGPLRISCCCLVSWAVRGPFFFYYYNFEQSFSTKQPNLNRFGSIQ